MRSTIVIVISVLSFVFTQIANCDDLPPLPRAVGALHLDMGWEEFYRITQSHTYPCPFNSHEFESCASLNFQETNKIVPLTDNIDSVDVIFWKGKIYFIDASYNVKGKQKYIGEFIDTYGKNYTEHKSYSSTEWYDKKTNLIIRYDKNGEVLLMTLIDISENRDGSSY